SLIGFALLDRMTTAPVPSEYVRLIHLSSSKSNSTAPTLTRQAFIPIPSRQGCCYPTLGIVSLAPSLELRVKRARFLNVLTALSRSFVFGAAIYADPG